MADESLIEQLQALLARLAPSWAEYLKRTQGLDLGATPLAAELARPLTVDRTLPGFEDFAATGIRAIEPGAPALSLLYHALASPNVRPAATTTYPSWADLDLVENYIYSLRPLAPSDLVGKVIGVFAYQYRPKPATTHQAHADLAFSRTGLSRVGTVEAHYVGSDRGYSAYTGTAGQLGVLPARYGAFVAEWRSGKVDELSLIGEPVAGDAERKFLYPLHKLFPGDACVTGRTLALEFSESHLSAKLARLVGPQGKPNGRATRLPAGLDPSQAPFIRQSPDPELVDMQALGSASVRISAPPRPIVRLARQHNTVTGRDEIARFVVPPAIRPTTTEIVATIMTSASIQARVPKMLDKMHGEGLIETLHAGLSQQQAKLEGQLAQLEQAGQGDSPAAAQVNAGLTQVAELSQITTVLQAQSDFGLAALAKAFNQPQAAVLQMVATVLATVVGQRGLVLNRHYTSMSLVGDIEDVLLEYVQTYLHEPAQVPRKGPEFANIRHQVIDPSWPSDARDPAVLARHLCDLNTLPSALEADPSHDAMLERLSAGGYEAALFEDGTGDGCVTVTATGLGAHLHVYPAFSTMSAPSFFPRSDDLDLESWYLLYGEQQFREGDPIPLAEGRYSANPAIRRPGGSVPAFDFGDHTMTAMVGAPTGQAGNAPREVREHFATSFLPDSASNEFYPGWDVTIDNDGNGFFYTTHGLGSPYPEDVKFCSAANGFWPAASPDSARVFHRVDTPTAIPLLDTELGYHPDHPAVTSGEVHSAIGWDGGYGPFFQAFASIEGQLAGPLAGPLASPLANGAPAGSAPGVNYASMNRTDYVSNSLAGGFGSALFGQLDSTTLIERMEVQRLCVVALPPGNDEVELTPLWLILAHEVADWSTQDPVLSGHGYLFQFAIPTAEQPLQLEHPLDTQTNAFTRMWQAIQTVYTCRVTTQGVRWWEGSGECPADGGTLYQPGSTPAPRARRAARAVKG